MKVRRSDRLIDMTRFLLERPRTLISLSFFADRYESAKSSISEDLTILKRTFQERGTGLLETLPGAAGGARFIPYILKEDAEAYIAELCAKVSDSHRVMPGGYVYLSDLLGEPAVLRQLGRLIATQYMNQTIDRVLTVSVKGIPLAQAVAEQLNVPFVIARQDGAITDGATVSVNYVSGSSTAIEKMQISKRALPANSKVLIVDDFVKGGGTISGLASLVRELDSEVVGVTVFGEGRFSGQRQSENFTALLHIETLQSEVEPIRATPGDYLERVFGNER
ncbi:pur operon repressor [Furfurilactobacillus siliginis]|uniref:Pur operon repressor n=1 Tax=Furfurilactobacillus siliginis TaxID=348151 RepID=A0A0R2LBD2_9LACO|nr:pur operon repressor [Furfurilactobacillus siliginis]KRN95981.1 purine biosynthesis operon repressor [Furfurilactobacillus siliginis]GEK28836.1 pur operon repressor [Furfurilactobacillus siliginis]